MKLQTLFGRRLPKIRAQHLSFLGVIVVANFGQAFLFRQILGDYSVMPAIVVFVWIFLPCKDVQFGNGRKFHWLRQTCLLVGTWMTLIVGVMRPLFHH